MYIGHGYMSGITAFRQFYTVMCIVEIFQAIIASPTISKYCRPRKHRVFYKRNQALSGSIRNSLHPNPTETSRFMYFNSDHNNRFSTCSTTTFSTLIFVTQQGFVDFNTSTQFVSTRSYHGSSQFMEPTPSSLITPQAKNSLKPKGVSPKFLTCNVPYRLKPKLERFPCSLEDRSGRNGDIMPAYRASDQVCPDFPSSMCIAYRTSKTLRPTKPEKIVNAGLLSIKPFIKFLQRSGIIHAACRVIGKLACHGPILSQG